MIEVTRETQLLQTFATLADTLVDDYDVFELLQTLVDACHELLDFSAAGILLADRTGELELVASTSEATRLVETMQLAAAAGPCIQSYRTGSVVSIPDISESPRAWDQFRSMAIEQGFAAVDAIPLRLRTETIGALNLLRTHAGAASPDDLVAARAFADVATIGILHERSLRESTVLSEQLQAALNSRVLIEQAKGVVSHTADVPLDSAFTLIREYARAHQMRLSHLASLIVERTVVVAPPASLRE